MREGLTLAPAWEDGRMPEIPAPAPDPTWQQRWEKRAAVLVGEVRQRYGAPPGEPVLSSERPAVSIS